MSTTLRVALIVVSLLTVFFVLKKIRKAQLNIDDSIYWIISAFLLLLLSLFPQIAIFASKLLGIESPANFVFLFMIFVILVRQFTISIDLSIQKRRLNMLIQRLALLNHEQELEKKDQDSDGQ